MTSTASCLAITTLVVVSLANMLLLVHMILVKRCDDLSLRRAAMPSGIRPRDGRPLDDQVMSANFASFMSAIVFVGGGEQKNEVKFICGAAIISKYWAITPAHCAEIILNRFMDNIKISSNSSKLKYGTFHDVESVIMHEKFDSLRRYNDLALVKVKQPFKGKFENPIPVAGQKFKYIANTSAVTWGWMSSGADQDQQANSDEQHHLYGFDVKLFWFKNCEFQYADENISDNAMFCAGRYKNEMNICVHDYGGQLVQNSLLVGMVSFGGIGCEFAAGSDLKPVVYTKLSMFENWIKAVEKREGVSMEVVFKKKT